MHMLVPLSKKLSPHIFSTSPHMASSFLSITPMSIQSHPLRVTAPFLKEPPNRHTWTHTHSYLLSSFPDLSTFGSSLSEIILAVCLVIVCLPPL